MGETNFVHCLTGWLPEQVPLDTVYRERIWKLLLKVVPNWKLPQPPPSKPSDDQASLDVKCMFCKVKKREWGIIRGKIFVDQKIDFSSENTYKNLQQKLGNISEL